MSLFVWQVAILEYSYFMTMNKSSFCSKMRNLNQKLHHSKKKKIDMRERETEITPWPTGIVPLPVQGDRTLSPIRGRRSNQMTFGGQLSSRHSCGPCPS